MKQALKKLHNSRGASVVLAILFFLVCVMVASVIITAATVNAGRTDKQRDEQQVYLAVSSAARLLQEDIQKLTAFKAGRVKTEYTCIYPSIHQNSLSSWNTLDACSGATLANYFSQAAFSICTGDPIWRKPFTITADAEELASIPVHVVMSMDTSYHVKCVLTAESATGSSYTVTLSIAGTADTYSEPDSTQYCTHLEQSTEMQLINGEWVYPVVERHYTINKTTYTTTVTWGAGTISKGG